MLRCKQESSKAVRKRAALFLRRPFLPALRFGRSLRVRKRAALFLRQTNSAFYVRSAHSRAALTPRTVHWTLRGAAVPLHEKEPLFLPSTHFVWFIIEVKIIIRLSPFAITGCLLLIISFSNALTAKGERRMKIKLTYTKTPPLCIFFPFFLHNSQKSSTFAPEI